MRVLFLNTWDVVGGAARSAFRLHKGLREFGLDVRMLVQHKKSSENTVIGPQKKIDSARCIYRPILDQLPLLLYPNRKKITFSPAVFPDGLWKKVEAFDPDIIHLHWIGGGFIRPETIKYFKKPLVWTLHDSWAFTGGCHIPFECTRYLQSCGSCPVLGSSSDRDLSRWIWKRKHKSWRNLNINIITPSRWLSECAKSSSIFCNSRIEVIPNGLDLNTYKPFEKKIAREIFSLPFNKKLIMFGGFNSIDDHNKGFHLLTQALQIVGDGKDSNFSAELVVFGASEPVDAPDIDLKAHYFGDLHDEVSLAMLYSAADVFVSPSIQENLPNVIIESMACGTPCVAFNQGGMPDLIDHEQNGYLASPFDTEDLKRGITWILEDEIRWRNLSRQARAKAQNMFSIGIAAKSYTHLYKEIIGNNGEEK